MPNIMSAMRGARIAFARLAGRRLPTTMALAIFASMGISAAHAGSCSDRGAKTLVRSLRSEDSGPVARAGRGCVTMRSGDLGRRAMRRPRNGSSYVASGAMVYCVRPSDGYFFPTPHSQFGGEKNLETTLDACRAICAEQTMDVYVLHDPSLETEAMVSLTSGKPYLELGAAHAFRESADFRACDMQRYFRPLNEARARAMTPYDLGDASVPVPTLRPERMAAAEVEPEPAERAPMPPVRSVGPVFLPD